MSEATLWMTTDKSRFFAVPNDNSLSPGDFTIIAPLGQRKSVDSASLSAFEISETQAISWARSELGDSLTELKQNIEAKLDDWRRQLDEFNNAPWTQKTKVTPEAGSVFYELLAALPQVFSESTSGDEVRVESARKKMNDFERRFTEAGLDVHDRAAAFPERLAKIAAKSFPA